MLNVHSFLAESMYMYMEVCSHRNVRAVLVA